jgi:hypothetical protein
MDCVRSCRKTLTVIRLLRAEHTSGKAHNRADNYVTFLSAGDARMTSLRLKQSYSSSGCIRIPISICYLRSCEFGEEYKSRSSSLCSFSTFPSLHPSLVEISSLAPCSQTPSAYVAALVSGTRFHTHTKSQAKL